MRSPHFTSADTGTGAKRGLRDAHGSAVQAPASPEVAQRPVLPDTPFRLAYALPATTGGVSMSVLDSSRDACWTSDTSRTRAVGARS